MTTLISLEGLTPDDLALLTPSERQELDRLLQAPMDIRDWLAVLPFWVKIEVLEGIRRLHASLGRAADGHATVSFAELDLPGDLKEHLLDAARAGTWRGPRCPLTDAEHQELLDWLEARHRRLDALLGLVEVGEWQTSVLNLLYVMRQGPRHEHGWTSVRVVRDLKARFTDLSPDE
jgi:hypothetical protein